MTTPSVPPDAATAAATSSGYPFCFILGTVIPPMAATVAGLEPEMAPKNAEATTVIQDRRPGILLISISIKSMSRLEMPPFSIMFPASIKKGTAIRVKLSAWVNILWATAGSRFRFPLATIATHTAIPRQMAMGTPRNSMTNKTPNNIPIIIFSLPVTFSNVCHA